MRGHVLEKFEAFEISNCRLMLNYQLLLGLSHNSIKKLSLDIFKVVGCTTRQNLIFSVVK